MRKSAANPKIEDLDDTRLSEFPIDDWLAWARVRITETPNQETAIRAALEALALLEDVCRTGGVILRAESD